MPTPSLILVPARFKTGKLYTPLATTSGGTVLGASGDFNVTRATAATRVNASGYIESVASGVPRLDYYTSGGTAGCPALLVEPSAQNICLQSAAFGTSPWGTVSTTVTVNTSATVDPFNGNTADKLVANSGLANHWLERNSVQTGNHTFSVFAKAAEYGFIRLIDVNASRYNASFSLSGSGSSSGTGSSIQNYGNGWYRCVVTYDGGGANVYNSLIGIPTAATTINYNGDGTSGVYIFGAQLETGSVATSYIPTTTAAATRNADVISLSGAVSGCIGQTEGTIYAEVDIRNLTNADSVRIVSLTTTTNSNNFIEITKRSSTQLRCDARLNSGSTITFLTVSGFVLGVNKIAFAYQDGNYAMAINGAVTTSAQAGMTSSLNTIILGAAASNIAQLNDRIRAAALYTTRLTNTELAALTTL